MPHPVTARAGVHSPVPRASGSGAACASNLMTRFLVVSISARLSIGQSYSQVNQPSHATTTRPFSGCCGSVTEISITSSSCLSLRTMSPRAPSPLAMARSDASGPVSDEGCRRGRSFIVTSPCVTGARRPEWSGRLVRRSRRGRARVLLQDVSEPVEGPHTARLHRPALQPGHRSQAHPGQVGQPFLGQATLAAHLAQQLAVNNGGPPGLVSSLVDGAHVASPPPARSDPHVRP